MGRRAVWVALCLIVVSGVIKFTPPAFAVIETPAKNTIVYCGANACITDNDVEKESFFVQFNLGKAPLKVIRNYSFEFMTAQGKPFLAIFPYPVGTNSPVPLIADGWNAGSSSVDRYTYPAFFNYGWESPIVGKIKAYIYLKVSAYEIGGAKYSRFEAYKNQRSLQFGEGAFGRFGGKLSYINRSASYDPESGSEGSYGDARQRDQNPVERDSEMNKAHRVETEAQAQADEGEFLFVKGLIALVILALVYAILKRI
jgi:hypothetical protein